MLRRAYEGFNRHDIDAVFSLMADDVEWPNAMEGTMIRGKPAIRAYWMGQWEKVDARVEPVSIMARADGVVVVRVDQTVRTLDGDVISEGPLDHEYRIEGGLIRRMDVLDEAPGNRFVRPADA